MKKEKRQAVRKKQKKNAKNRKNPHEDAENIVQDVFLDFLGKEKNYCHYLSIFWPIYSLL